MVLSNMTFFDRANNLNIPKNRNLIDQYSCRDGGHPPQGQPVYTVKKVKNLSGMSLTTLPGWE
jgi:hypothetical protein